MSVKRTLMMSGACGVLASTIGTVLAQEASRGPTEVVIVTGSYIRGTPEDAALPVDVITAEDLAKEGSPSTLEIIKSLSVSNGVLGDTNQFDARAQGSEGTGSVNLRGFGPQRTLVLLNGRRLVTSPFGGGGIVDTNLIPSAAIGRVEVLKDGAAATYGSDAIAGVVNFITKSNLRGLDVGADFKAIDDSDGDYTISGSFGWGNDRASALFAAGMQHRSELMVKDRDWALRSITENPQGGWSAAGNPSSFVPLYPGATPLAAPTTGAPVRDPQCAALGGVPGAVSNGTPVCYWQYTQFDALTEKEDRYQLYGEFNLDLGETVKWHSEALYAETEVPIYRTSPSYAALQTPSAPIPGQFFVPANNPGWAPFVTANPGVFPANGSGASPIGALVIASRPFALGGNPLFNYGSSEGPREYDAYRISTGLQGEFGPDIGWDVAVTYMEQNASRTGRDTVVNRFQLALRGLGGPNCTTDTPGQNGCFWYNPFNNAIPGNSITGQSNAQYVPAVGNANPALLEWMFPEVSTDQQTTTTVVDVVLDGSTTIELPGGDIAWAFGAQYRERTFEARYSDLNNFAVTPCVNSVSTGIIGPSACTPAQLAAPTGPLMFLGGANDADLRGDIYAVFGELSLPLFESLEMQLAARYEDYGGKVGSTFDPKLSLRWQVIDQLALRGSVGTTFRGPDLNLVDPSSITTLQAVAGTFRAVRTFGNPSLKPESAFTFNLGAIVRAGGFSGSLDYWSFDFEDSIIQEPLADMVSFVFQGGSCTLSNPLASRFAFRDGNNDGVIDDADCSTANITRVDRNNINGPDIKTTGLDVSLRYDFDDLLGGSARLGFNATYVFNFDVGAAFVAGNQVASPRDAAGKLNYQTTAYPLPQLKGNVFAEYRNGAHNLRYVLNYVDEYEDQRFTSPSPGRTIERTVMHDLHYLVELPAETSLNLSVENFTDEDPSFARLDLSYDPFTSSAQGRIFKVGLRKLFGAN